MIITAACNARIIASAELALFSSTAFATGLDTGLHILFPGAPKSIARVLGALANIHLNISGAGLDGAGIAHLHIPCKSFRCKCLIASGDGGTVFTAQLTLLSTTSSTLALDAVVYAGKASCPTC